ncbi:MAG TPA: sugar transferase, partial [Acidimicrobiales bacterium]|nr:sugar transferase [Acidimicrobiales bacterium]
AKNLNPWWLQVACGWHQAGRHPGPIVADLAFASGALLAAGATAGAAALATSVLFASGLLFGLWKRRLPYESQGMLWYARHLTPASAAVGFTLAMYESGVTTDRVALSALAMSFTLIGVRALIWPVIARARRRGLGLTPALVIGQQRRIEQIRHRLMTYPEAGFRFDSSFVPERGSDESPESARALVNDLLGKHDVEHVICVADEVEEAVFLDFVRFSKGQVDVSLVLPVATLCAGHVRSSIGDLGVHPLRLRPSWGSVAAKRAFDAAVALVTLVVLSPVLLLAAAAIRLQDGGPILFRQRRVGRDGKQFTIFKFRSMVVGAEDLQLEYRSYNFVNRGLLFKLEKDPRVTQVGGLLRRLSIDELPQFFNVLRGDMSLVGPRPLAVEPEEFDIRAQIRHQATPGITGMWQALGANALDYDDMLDLDLAYVATRSFGVDFLTILRTIPAVLIRRSPA